MLLKTHVQVHLLAPLFAVGVWRFSVFRLKKTISIDLSCLFYGMSKSKCLALLTKTRTFWSSWTLCLFYE